jgi:hypothetical protein
MRGHPTFIPFDAHSRRRAWDIQLPHALEERTVGYATGTLVAAVVAVFARVVGFDRERSFYSAVLIVVAHYYVLFAAMAGSMRALAIESIGLAAFAICAAVGFRRRYMLVAAGLVGHGVFDFFHAGLVDNPGVPAWWPPFCLSFDVVAGAWVAWSAQRTGAVPLRSPGA